MEGIRKRMACLALSAALAMGMVPAPALAEALKADDPKAEETEVASAANAVDGAAAEQVQDAITEPATQQATDALTGNNTDADAPAANASAGDDAIAAAPTPAEQPADAADAALQATDDERGSTNLSAGCISLNQYSYQTTGKPVALEFTVYDDEYYEVPAASYELVYYIQTDYDDDGNEIYEKLEGAPTDTGSYYVSAKGRTPYTGETAKEWFRIYDPLDLRSMYVQFDGEEFDLDQGDVGAAVAAIFELETVEGELLTQGKDYVLCFYDRNDNALDAAPTTPGRYTVAAVPAPGSSYTGATFPYDVVVTGTYPLQTMVLGQTYDINLMSEEQRWVGSFTAGQAGTYFFSAPSHDVSAVLYADENLTRELNSASSWNGFKLRYELAAGQTVYLAITDEDPGWNTISVTARLYNANDLSFGSIEAERMNKYLSTGSVADMGIAVYTADDKLVPSSGYTLEFRDEEDGPNLSAAPTIEGHYCLRAVGVAPYTGTSDWLWFTVAAADDIDASNVVFDKRNLPLGADPADYVKVYSVTGSLLEYGTHYTLAYYGEEDENGEDVQLAGIPTEPGEYMVRPIAIAGSGYHNNDSNYTMYGFTLYDVRDIGGEGWEVTLWPSDTVQQRADGTVELPSLVIYSSDDSYSNETRTLLTEGKDYELVGYEVATEVEDEFGDTVAEWRAMTAGATPSNPGRYRVTYKGCGSYHGTVRETLDILEAEAQTTAVDLDSIDYDVRSTTLAYTGEALTPEIRFFDDTDGDGRYLVEGTDFEAASYKVGHQAKDEYGDEYYEFEELTGTPTNPGVYQVTYQGKGIYGGSLDVRYSIERSAEQVSVKDLSKGYLGLSNYYFDVPETGKSIDLGIKVYNSHGLVLTEGTHYELAYYNAVVDDYDDYKESERLASVPATPGTYCVVAHALEGGGFSGHTDPRTFTIEKQGSSTTTDPVVTQAMSLGTTYNVGLAQGAYWLGSFRAPKDGIYLFESTGSEDSYGQLFEDEAMQNELSHDDDGGESINFRIAQRLTKGTTVYLRASGLSGRAIVCGVSVREADTTFLHNLANSEFGIKKSDLAYTGKRVVLDVDLRDIADNVIPTSAYELEYNEKRYGVWVALDGAPTETGSYRVRACAKGSSYSGTSDWEPFEIYQTKDLENHAYISINDGFWSEDACCIAVYGAAGTEVKPSISVRYYTSDGSEVLAEGTDYEVRYVGTTSPSSFAHPARVIVEGKNDYTGRLSRAYAVVTQVDLGELYSFDGYRLSAGGRTFASYEDAEFLATGAAIEPQVELLSLNEDIALVAGDDYSVSYESVDGTTSDAAPMEPGSYALVLTGRGTRCTGTAILPFQVVEAGASELKPIEVPTGIAGLVYNGQSQRGINASESYWFEDSPYATDAGTYTVQVQPSEGYCWTDGTNGPKDVSWTIAKAKSTIKLTKQSKTYNGKPLAYTGTVTKTGSAGKVSYAYYSDKACTKSVATKKVKSAGTYYVKATLAADKNYAAASAVATFTIAKAANTLTVVAKPKAKTASVKASTLKAKAQTVKAANVATVSKAQGTVTYKKVSGPSGIKISKTGVITLAKGMAKKTYTVKIRVSAAGNTNYKAGSKTVECIIVVK